MTAVGYSNLDIKVLKSDLIDVIDWFDLGISLGLKPHNLKKIESQYRGNIERCKIEMLEFWKKKDKKASLQKLTDALEKIDHHILAMRLRERHKKRVWQEGIATCYNIIITLSTSMPITHITIIIPTYNYVIISGFSLHETS